jgi:hypothetical protein
VIVFERDSVRSAPMPTSMLWWKKRSLPVLRNRSVVAARTSPPNLSGCWRQHRWATIEPIE